ncbi:F-box/LRR-repeat protein 5-like isoform X2 [Zootermopsis nevadensis]|nr:F-box/LRR-repeat protein 5-like isoform X2 [Zootermopsis nevadensis]
MMALIDDGIAVRSRSSEDSMAFGMRLQQALNDFTSTFLPHMEQEEEIFQPLLVKHFEYSELQSIQQLVIVKHCALTNNVIYETLHTGLYSEDDELWVMEKQSGDGKRMAYYECIRNELNSAVSQHAVFEHLQSFMGNSIYTGHGSPDEETASVVMTQDCTGGPTFMDIPDLAVTKIFSYLDPPDLGRCAQVCWEWNNLVYQPCLWRRVCPTQWAVGLWRYEKNWNAEQHRISVLHGRRQNDYSVQGIILHDLPYFGLGIVEPDDSVLLDIPHAYTDLVNRFQSEFRIISGLLRFVLWRVGSGVKELNLGASCVLNDMILNLFMLQCPNIVCLDVSYTALSFKAFHGLKGNGSCRLLTTVSFSGCENLEDSAIISLTKCWENEPEEFNDELIDRDMQRNLSSVLVLSTLLTEKELLKSLIGISDRRMQSGTGRDDEMLVSIPYIECRKKARVSGLHSLILSGCHKLTDKSLEELIKSSTFTQKLRLLDMSGCFRFTARMLNNLVNKCPILSPEYLFYCDHITGGPYSNEANGCNNLQSAKRACCIPPE